MRVVIHGVAPQTLATYHRSNLTIAIRIDLHGKHNVTSKHNITGVQRNHCNIASQSFQAAKGTSPLQKSISFPGGGTINKTEVEKKIAHIAAGWKRAGQGWEGAKRRRRGTIEGQDHGLQRRSRDLCERAERLAGRKTKRLWSRPRGRDTRAHTTRKIIV